MNTPVTHCACGVEQALVEVIRVGNFFPSYVPGPLLEPCCCPRCITCGYVLDEDGCCDHIGCPIYGTFIPIPDVPGSQAHDGSTWPDPAGDDNQGEQ